MSSMKNKVSSRKVVKNKKQVKPLKAAPKKKDAKKASLKTASFNQKKKAAPTKKSTANLGTKKPAPTVKSKAPGKKTLKAPAKGKVTKITPKKVIVKKAAPVKKTAPPKKTTPAKKMSPTPVLKKKVELKKTAVKKEVDIKKPLAKKQEAKPIAAKNSKETHKTVERKETPTEKPKSPADVFSKKPVQKSATDVLAISNTIPVKQKYEISASKIASISNSITNPIKKTDSYAIKPEKEPAGKFEMEFVIHASADMLYEFLSTPSGLSEWFCDDLNIRNGIYTFIWDDQLQQARLLKTLDLQLVRFQWVDKTDGSYFEFKVQRDDLTNDISLIITDFADSAGDRESSKLLWNSQVEKLMHVIGSIF